MSSDIARDNEETSGTRWWRLDDFSSSSFATRNKKNVEPAHLCSACQLFLSGTTKATRFWQPKEPVVRQFSTIVISAREGCHNCARYIDSLSESSQTKLNELGTIHVYALSNSDVKLDGYRTNQDTGLMEQTKLEVLQNYVDYETIMEQPSDELRHHMEDELVDIYARDIHFDPFPGSRSEDRGFKLFREGMSQDFGPITSYLW